MQAPKRDPLPRLHQDVKSMNGKSTKRLSESIDALTDLLDDKEVQNEQMVEEPDTLRDPNSE